MRLKIAFPLIAALAGLGALANPAKAAHCGACTTRCFRLARNSVAFLPSAIAFATKPYSKIRRRSAIDRSIAPS